MVVGLNGPTGQNVTKDVINKDHENAPIQLQHLVETIARARKGLGDGVSLEAVQVTISQDSKPFIKVGDC